MFAKILDFSGDRLELLPSVHVCKQTYQDLLLKEGFKFSEVDIIIKH